jgi:hypothetical protein
MIMENRHKPLKTALLDLQILVVDVDIMHRRRGALENVIYSSLLDYKLKNLGFLGL